MPRVQKVEKNGLIDISQLLSSTKDYLRSTLSRSPGENADVKEFGEGSPFEKLTKYLMGLNKSAELSDEEGKSIADKIKKRIPKLDEYTPGQQQLLDRVDQILEKLHQERVTAKVNPLQPLAEAALARIQADCDAEDIKRKRALDPDEGDEEEGDLRKHAKRLIKKSVIKGKRAHRTGKKVWNHPVTKGGRKAAKILYGIHQRLK